MRCCNFRALHFIHHPMKGIETAGISPSHAAGIYGAAFPLSAVIHFGIATFEVREGKECT